MTPEPFVATPIVNNPSAVLSGVPKAKLFSLFGWPAIAAIASVAVGSATTNDAELNPIACEELNGADPSPADADALPGPPAAADELPVALVTREVPAADALALAFPVVLSVVMADASPGMPAAAPLNAGPLTPPVAVLEPESELPVVAVPFTVAVADPPFPAVFPVPSAAPPLPPVAKACRKPRAELEIDTVAVELALPPLPPLASLNPAFDPPPVPPMALSLTLSVVPATAELAEEMLVALPPAPPTAADPPVIISPPDPPAATPSAVTVTLLNVLVADVEFEASPPLALLTVFEFCASPPVAWLEAMIFPPPGLVAVRLTVAVPAVPCTPLSLSPPVPPFPFSFSCRVPLVEPLTIVGPVTVLSLAKSTFAPLPPLRR